MSEYTREEILKMIEERGGAERLWLAGVDLSGIDLSRRAITKELERYRSKHPGETPAWFSETTKGINLCKANLERANLQKANLSGVNFQEAKLRHANVQEAALMQANLQEAKLMQAKLQKANLSWANLQKGDLGGANLRQANLRGATLQQTDLGYANLEEAYLASAKLQEADLRGARLQRASLLWTDLRKANLGIAHLETLDMYYVESMAGAYFQGTFLDRTRMRKEHLGAEIGEEVEREYDLAKEAYLLLKNNFNQIGRYDDASWAYIKERQMEKRTYHPKLARKYYAEIEALPEGASPKSCAWWRFYVKYTLKWAWDWIIEGLCGYGDKPGRVLRAMLLLLVIAPFAYRLFGGLTHTDGRVATALDYLVYSFDAFSRIVGTDLVPLTMWGHLVTGLEAFLAVLLASLFIYTLGRRISRS